MEKTFPETADHNDALCFNCDGPLDSKPVETGYARGRGHWRQFCPVCEMFTFYDIARKVAA